MRIPGGRRRVRRFVIGVVGIGMLLVGIAALFVAVPVDVTTEAPANAEYALETVEFPSESSYRFTGSATGRQTHGYVVWLPGTDGWGSVESTDAGTVRMHESGWYDVQTNRTYWRRVGVGDGGRTVVAQYSEDGVLYKRLEGFPSDRVAGIAATVEESDDQRVLAKNVSAGAISIAYGSPGDEPRDGFTPTLTRYVPSTAISHDERASFVPDGVEQSVSGRITQSPNGTIRINASLRQRYPQGITHEGRASLATALFGPYQEWDVRLVVTPSNRSWERPEWVPANATAT